MEFSEWDDLMYAMAILRRGATGNASPFHCEHDKLWVNSNPGLLEHTEIEKLEELGFYPDEDGGFYSFRYGSA